MLPQALIVRVEIVKLIRQDVGIGNEVVLLPAEPLLHLDIVVTEAIFARDLVTLRKVVDPLMLIEALVHVALARGGRPAEVPLMRLGAGEGVCLKNRTYDFRLALQHLVKHLIIVNVVAAMTLHRPSY